MSQVSEAEEGKNRNHPDLGWKLETHPEKGPDAGPGDVTVDP